MIEKREPNGERGLVGSLRERKVARSLRQKIKFETLETSKRLGGCVGPRLHTEQIGSGKVLNGKKIMILVEAKKTLQIAGQSI